jgi:hypothetical protein
MAIGQNMICPSASSNAWMLWCEKNWIRGDTETMTRCVCVCLPAYSTFHCIVDFVLIILIRSERLCLPFSLSILWTSRVDMRTSWSTARELLPPSRPSWRLSPTLLRGLLQREAAHSNTTSYLFCLPFSTQMRVQHMARPIGVCGVQQAPSIASAHIMLFVCFIWFSQ